MKHVYVFASISQNDVWGFGLSSSTFSWSADYSLGVRKRAGIESFPEFGNSGGAVFETIQVNVFRIVYCGNPAFEGGALQAIAY